MRKLQCERITLCSVVELELELIQTQMTQKPMLRVEVGARALRNQTGGGRAAAGEGVLLRCSFF